MANTFRDKNFKILRSRFQKSVSQEAFDKIMKSNFASTEEAKDFFKKFKVVGKKFLVLNDKAPNYKPFKQRSNYRRKGNQKGRLVIKRSEKRSERNKISTEIRKEMDEAK